MVERLFDSAGDYTFSLNGYGGIDGFACLELSEEFARPVIFLRSSPVSAVPPLSFLDATRRVCFILQSLLSLLSFLVYSGSTTLTKLSEPALLLASSPMRDSRIESLECSVSLLARRPLLVGLKFFWLTSGLY